MVFKNTKDVSFLIGCVQRSARIFMFLCLVIVVAIYLSFFILSSFAFSQQRQLLNSTSINISINELITQVNAPDVTASLLLNEIQILEANMNLYREEMKSMSASLLEAEKEKHQQTKASLMEKLKRFEEELKQEKEKSAEMSKFYKSEKEILEANATLYREAFDYMAVALRNTSYHGVENYTRYARARLGMLPLKNVKQLKPEFGPVVNDFLSFRYRLSPPPCQDVAANRSVFIAVISAPDHFEKRNLIRQTWRKHLNSSGNQEGLMGLAGFSFSLGLTENNVTQSKIDEESKTYGDILQSEMSDSYRNLTLKLGGLFNWLYKNCEKVDFVFKVDDDVYVNVRNLVHLVQTYHPSNQSMFGTASANFFPIRGGKWEMTYEQWPWNQYHPFLMGGAVLMPQSTIVPLLAAFQTTPLVPFEDVYLSGMCSEKASIRLHFSSNKFSVLKWKLPSECELRRVAAWLTDNQHISHAAAENFYYNTTHKCIETDSNGVNRTVNHNDPVSIFFT